VLALSRADLRQLVTMPEAIELMKVAFRELSNGRAQSPLRTVIDVEHGSSAALLMPAFVPAEGALGLKVVSVFQANPSKQLPTIHALVCLVDHETGAPLAIMEGAYVTALRTGAVSGAATDLLARPDSRTLVVIGAGVQGVTQAAAVCAVRPIERIIAVDPSLEALERYEESIARDWPDLSERLETTTSPSEAVKDADVICTATTSRRPVFQDSDVKPGTHINGVGAFTPEMQELPAETVSRATVVLDSTEAALAEAGDLIIPLNEGRVSRDHFSRELGHLVDGTATGRTSDDEITLFKSVGNAVQDVVVARKAVDRSRERGIGFSFDLG
jgi:ornithine cyclodeaminase/alanine dehydrogenase-like protein (mu-crystallin family)